MARLWLPKPVGERYQMIKRLRELGVYVAGAETLDLSHLRDILAKYEEQEAKPKPPREFSMMPREQVAAALKDWRDFVKARREGRRRVY